MSETKLGAWQVQPEGGEPHNEDELPIFDANEACIGTAYPMGEDFDSPFPGPNQTRNAIVMAAASQLLASLEALLERVGRYRTLVPANANAPSMEELAARRLLNEIHREVEIRTHLKLWINVTQTVADLDSEVDEDVQGLYVVRLPSATRELSTEQQACIALDAFHERIGIRCLDDFEIVVLDADDDVLDPAESGSFEWDGDDADVSKVSDTPTAAQRMAANP